jgi:hypothetical protein
MCAETTNWYRHQLIVMGTQWERPNRIERIQNFKGSACVLVQLFQFMVSAQISVQF